MHLYGDINACPHVVFAMKRARIPARQAVHGRFDIGPV